jgi:hypothetical protein
MRGRRAAVSRATRRCRSPASPSRRRRSTLPPAQASAGRTATPMSTPSHRTARGSTPARSRRARPSDTPLHRPEPSTTTALFRSTTCRGRWSSAQASRRRHRLPRRHRHLPRRHRDHPLLRRHLQGLHPHRLRRRRAHARRCRASVSTSRGLEGRAGWSPGQGSPGARRRGSSSCAATGRSPGSGRASGRAATCSACGSAARFRAGATWRASPSVEPRALTTPA